MSVSESPEFIGIGWSFPPTFDRGRRRAVMSSGVEDIEQSLRIIFSTTLGERVMRPDFGCGLDGHVHDAMNDSMVGYLERLITNAVLYHEPRIDADEISVVPDHLAGRLLITLGYTIRGSNSRFNMVYPYDLEASG